MLNEAIAESFDEAKSVLRLWLRTDVELQVVLAIVVGASVADPPELVVERLIHGVSLLRQPSMRITLPIAALIIQTVVATAEEWSVYHDRESVCQISYPRNLFARDGPVVRGVARFTGPNEETFCRVMEAENQGELSLKALKSKYFSENVPGKIIYERSTDDFLVFSGYRRDRIFYARVELSPDKGTMCIFEITYPREQKRSFDKLVTRMSYSLSAIPPRD